MDRSYFLKATFMPDFLSRAKPVIPMLSLVFLTSMPTMGESSHDKQLTGAHNELATLYGTLKGEWEACSKDGYLANFQYSIPLVTQYKTSQHDPDIISAASALLHVDISEKLRLRFESILKTHNSKSAEAPLSNLLRTDFYQEYSALPERLKAMFPDTSIVAGLVTTKGSFSEFPAEQCRWEKMAPETDRNKPITEL